MSNTFENTLVARVDTMLNACTRCGKCVEVCPVTGPGGVAAEPRAVIDGIIDIYPFRILNVLEIVGESMGFRHADEFKQLKKLQDVEAIAADCRELAQMHGLDPFATRAAIQAMLDEQPLPLRGSEGD
jgi:ferredoxin